jgi:hypothetical protein
MRNTLSMVAVGIGLLSPGCKARDASPSAAPSAARADDSMADRVEVAAPSGRSATVERERARLVTEGAGAAGSGAGGGMAAAPADKPEAAMLRSPEPLRPAPAPAPPPPSRAAGASVTASPPPAEPAGPVVARGDVAASMPAANVRAGEWDDNANYRDYVRWLQETPRGIARLDVSNRQFLVVEDAAGKPVPNCQIAITGGQRTVSLVTTASGRALLFPRAMGLGGGVLAASASCGQAAVQAAIRTDRIDGVTELKLATERVLPARRTVDLAFVLDTTGSMGEEIDAVKSTIRTVAARLGTDQTDVRIGLVAYKDRGDAEVTHVYPFSSDLAAFSRSVARIQADGGGDYPEDMQAGLSLAIDQLAWRSDATARLVVVIADAPPHLDYQDERDYADAARRAAGRGIKMFTVAASGMDATGQVVMRQMAQFTGASNLFVLRGGAGPQSVGGGDPQSSCGGSHEQYASGNLDQLIVAKVKRELAAVDRDPLQIAGRGQDENAKPCDQRIAIASW